MSNQSSSQISKPSLSSFRYIEETLASANIGIDEITRYQVPPDLYNMMDEMVETFGTVTTITPMSSHPCVTAAVATHCLGTAFTARRNIYF